MPLHINLYHEVQRQERARQRDPVRLGMLGTLVIAIGFVANYFIVLEEAHSVGIRYSGLQDEFSKLDPKAKDAKARQAELNDEITASDTMMKNVDSRFYWAPVLDQLVKSVPRNIQLTHVGADAPGSATSPGVLTLTGISSAAEPRKEAEALRTALQARLNAECKGVTSVFKQLDDSDEVVVLDGRRLPTATFTIEFQLQMADPPAPPAPAPVFHKSTLAAAE
jgi:Tfp pilus assembly protein PilN